MQIPGFNEYGLLDDGIYECTMSEVEAALAWNYQRRRLTASLQAFSSMSRVKGVVLALSLHSPTVQVRHKIQIRSSLIGFWPAFRRRPLV